MNIEIRPIKGIRTARYNPRKISDGQLASLKQSIERFGFVDPVIVNDRTGILVGGHQRIKAAKDLGLNQVPVVAVNLDEAEEKALNVALNKISGEWDLDLLRGVLEDVQAGGLDLSLTGFTDEEWSAMSGAAVGAVGLTDPDEAPELPEETETVTQPGDLWILGDHRLLCGDSTNPQHVERLMDGQKADFVYMDPPYGMKLDTDYSQNNAKQSQFKGNSYKAVEGDFEDCDPRPLIELFKSAKEQFWWGADYYCQTLSKDGSWVVWDKRNETTDEVQGAAFELCWSINKHHKLIYRQMWCGYTAREKTESRVHPTQKPVAMAEWFFDRWGAKGDIVVDLYGGSGTTLIACEKTSRHCRMMELDPAYCDVVIKRWEQFTGKKAVRDAG